MKRVVWLWFGLLCPGLAWAANPPVEASMLLVGTITVNPDGGVKDYAIRDSDEVPAGVLQVVKRSIGGWKFEPIVVDGKAVTAEAGMAIRLVADVSDQQHVTVRVAGASFGCSAHQMKAAFPGACPPDQELGYARTRAPVYPAMALRYGGEGTVFLLVEVARDGHVARVATQQVNLAHQLRWSGDAKRVRNALAKAAETAVGWWKFKVPTAGPNAAREHWRARIPMRFTFRNDRRPAYGHWNAYLPGPKHTVPWADGDAPGARADAVAGGGAFLRDARFVLKTPLDQAHDRS